MFTEPFTVHRKDHAGRGVQQGPQHGCLEAAQVAAQILMRADKPSRHLNPNPVWYIAAKAEGGRYTIHRPL